MRIRILISLCLLALSAVAIRTIAAEEPAQTDRDAPALTAAKPVKPTPVRTLSATDAIVLGVVEGVTEFLPISSTGHLLITNHALGLENDEPLRNPDGSVRWYKAPGPKHPEGVPLTLSELADGYVVIIQIGAIAAVLFLYTGQVMAMIRGLTGQNSSGLRLLRNVFIAFLPCVVIGLKTHEWIEKNLFSVGAVAVALISGAVLMIAAERWRKQTAGAGTSRLEPADLTIRQSLSIGVMQCLALWPGTSRSMVTMVGGYFCGLAPAKAAEFAFLIGLPTLAGAAALKSYQIGPALLEVFGWQPVLLGIAVAALSAFLAVKLFVTYLTRHGLVPFAIYRVFLAAILLAWFYL